MIKKNIAMFVTISLACFLSFPPSSWAVSRLHDITTQKIQSEVGTIEFRIKMLKDISADPHNHTLMLGVSSDGAENYSIKMIQGQLIARRMFRNCFLTVFSSPYQFRIGDWHRIKLTWNKESTKCFVDDREIKKEGPLSSDDFPKMVPGIRIGREMNFRIENFKSSSTSDVYVDSADEKFIRSSSCPNVGELMKQGAQEECRGVALINFPDQKSRNTIKSYIELLPADFAKSLKQVLYVPHERFSKRGEAGFADSTTGSIVLDGKYFSEPGVFFHEAAHLYDAKLMINIGVPDEKSEWVKISGVTCYFKGANLEEFAKDFEKTKEKNAILTPQGGQCAFEDLAIWVGTTYDYYLNHKTFSDSLNPSTAKFNPKHKQKLDFILRKGFISQDIYDKVTR